MGIHYCDENSSFIEKSLLWGTFIIMMNFQQCDEKIITIIKDFFIEK